MNLKNLWENLLRLCVLIALSRKSECEMLGQMVNLRSLKFVDIVYDDWNGIKRPIGLIHEIRLPSGVLREVFTFCCKGPRQPGLALFVRRRTGNLSQNMVLTHDGQDLIPAFLKHLPEEYRDSFFRAGGVRAAA